MFRFAKDTELAEEMQVKNFSISESYGVQRFFLNEQLWLRVVEVKDRIVGAPYWQQTEPEESCNWETLLYLIRDQIEDQKIPDLSVEGWASWPLGQPSLLSKAGVLQVLEIVYESGKTSEWPQRRET
ncbi:MAG: hypothetical protein AAF387_01695 [Pseudomonadota bacterium]